MAAIIEPRPADIVDLRHLRAGDLDDLLDEETEVWRRRLDWEFQPSADLVRRFVGMQALNGHALVYNSRVLGYAYFVCEERKGLVGDLYVRQEYVSHESESRLLSAILETMFPMPGIRRIESQLLMLRYLRPPLPRAEFLRLYNRNFMMVDLAGAGDLRLHPVAFRLRLQTWNERCQEDTAHLISRAYHGHIDSQINDQYNSTNGARRFLMNIVQYPGCGTFFPEGSWVAWSKETGKLCGVCLASLVASDIGHITQICVTPDVRGAGVGYELLRRSLGTLAAHGCRRASLTVTASNERAIQLYERMGFQTRRQFSAMVWDGF